MALINGLGNINIQNLSQMLGTTLQNAGVNIDALTKDKVDFTAQATELAQTEGDAKDAEAAKDAKDTKSTARNAATENVKDYNKFSQAFTKENVASLLDLDPKNLTEQQDKDLTELLYNINVANAERKERGEEPMTKDELNKFLGEELDKYKNGEESSLGQSLDQLGIKEVSDEQFDKINKALDAYNKNGQVQEEQAAQDQQQAQEAQEAQGANDAGGANGTGGTGGAGGAGGVGSAKESGPKEEVLPDDLNALQDMKAKDEGEIGELKNQIGDKQAQIADRKEQVAREALGDKTTLEQRSALRDYDKAKKEFSDANKAKQNAQKELTKAQQETASNEKALYANANAKAQNSQELSKAQAELASLKPPAKAEGEGAAEANAQAQAEYEAKKAEIQGRIDSLQNEKAQLEAEYQQLEQKKAELEQTQTDKEAEIKEQDDAMKSAQEEMDKAMKALTEESPEVKKALENDEQLKTLQADIEKLEKQISEKEQHIAKIDEKIAAVEAQDENVQAMREDEADQAFQKAAKDAGADIEGSIESTQESVAKDKYGKSYDQLTEDEKRAIEVEVDGQVTTATMEWAKDKLKDDPNNKEAKAVLEKGQANLDAQKGVTFCSLSHAIDAMPRGMRDGASEAMEKAIEAAEANGEDANLAAMNALSKFAKENMNSADLDDEGRAAMKELGLKTDDYAKTLERDNEGYNLLVEAGLAEADETRNKATDETSALFAQVKTGAMSQNIASMLEAMKAMVGMHEGNSADAAKINAITKKSGINCQTTPWCAAYAMNMLKDYGVLDSSTCSNINYCPTIRNWAREQGLWEGRGNGYIPQAGDAILFDWNGDGTAQHIGIVSGYDPDTGTIYTIEGNSSNSVREKSYSINQGCVMGFVNCGKQQK